MDLQNKEKTINKMVLVSPYLSVITLNVNRLNYSFKRHRMAEWILKNPQNSTVCCL